MTRHDPYLIAKQPREIFAWDEIDPVSNAILDLIEAQEAVRIAQHVCAVGDSSPPTHKSPRPSKGSGVKSIETKEMRQMAIRDFTALDAALDARGATIGGSGI